MNAWKIALPFLLLVLSGCQKNGEPALPKVPIPNKFNSMPIDYQTQQELPYEAWWKHFHDPELDQLIVKALANNSDMQIALSNLDHAKGQLKQVQLSWLPSLQILAGYSTNPAFGVPGAFYGATASYITNIAKLMNQQDLAKYNVEYHHAMIDGVRLTIIGQVASAYFTYIAEIEQLRLLNQLVNDQHQLVALCHDDIKIGLRNQIDLQLLLVQEKNTRAQINIVQHNIVLSQNALRFLINNNPGKIHSDRSFRHIDFTRFKPGSLPMSVLKNRPDIRMAALSVKGSKAALAMAYSDFFPKLQLDQFIGKAKLSYQPTAQFTDSYPIWGLSPSTFGEIEAQKGALRAQLNEYIKTVQNCFKEVDNDFSAHKQYTDFFTTTKAAERDYEEKYLLQTKLLKTGLISYNTLLESKLSYDQLALLTNQARLQLAMTLVLLYQDLAGGYKAKT